MPTKRSLNPFRKGDRVLYRARRRDAKPVPATVLGIQDETRCSIRLDKPTQVSSGRITQATVVTVTALERMK